ncbi:unnamed protein product [Closterium sp. NIES-64]|nr:unnamed protein product [Closterium sp. NIES-64]
MNNPGLFNSSDAADTTAHDGILSELVARKARAVDTRRHALVLLREFRSLNDSIAEANGKIQEALRAREKLKLTSARLKEQQTVIDELSAIIDKTTQRMYERDSEDVQLSLVTAGEAKLVAERLFARLARKVLRLRDKVASYSIAVTCRDEIIKSWEQRIPQAMEAEKITNATMRDYLAVFKRAMKSFPESERSILGIVQMSSSASRDESRGAPSVALGSVADDDDSNHQRQANGASGSSKRTVRPWNEKDDPYLAEIEAPHGEGTTYVKNGSEDDKNSQEKLHKSSEAVEEIAAADAEEAVVRGLLDSLRAEFQAWKSSIAEGRASEDMKNLRRMREELDNAEGDAEFAVFQVKEGEKDVEQANAELASAQEMADEQTRILREANEDLRRAMTVESAGTRTLGARLHREEAELVKAQAERVAGAMSQKVQRAEALVLERRQGLQDTMGGMERSMGVKVTAGFAGAAGASPLLASLPFFSSAEMLIAQPMAKVVVRRGRGGGERGGWESLVQGAGAQMVNQVETVHWEFSTGTLGRWFR